MTWSWTSEDLVGQQKGFKVLELNGLGVRAGVRSCDLAAAFQVSWSFVRSPGSHQTSLEEPTLEELLSHLIFGRVILLETFSMSDKGQRSLQVPHKQPRGSRVMFLRTETLS